LRLSSTGGSGSSSSRQCGTPPMQAYRLTRSAGVDFGRNSARAPSGRGPGAGPAAPGGTAATGWPGRRARSSRRASR
jgi:hypothetical protein